MWFAMFTAGMFFPVYLAAAGVLIPVLRVVTAPLRKLPDLAGGLVAIVVGGGLGVLVMSALHSVAIGDFILRIQTTIAANPAVSVGITLATTLGPLLLGAILDRDD